jgi:DNA-directed RNA polymerase specialized sigma24 family protein
MDVAQIAEALGISEGTAKTWLYRARRSLAEALGEPLMEEASDAGL